MSFNIAHLKPKELCLSTHPMYLFTSDERKKYLTKKDIQKFNEYCIELDAETEDERKLVAATIVDPSTNMTGLYVLERQDRNASILMSYLQTVLAKYENVTFLIQELISTQQKIDIGCGHYQEESVLNIFAYSHLDKVPALINLFSNSGVSIDDILTLLKDSLVFKSCGYRVWGIRPIVKSLVKRGMSHGQLHQILSESYQFAWEEKNALWHALMDTGSGNHFSKFIDYLLTIGFTDKQLQKLSADFKSSDYLTLVNIARITPAELPQTIKNYLYLRVAKKELFNMLAMKIWLGDNLLFYIAAHDDKYIYFPAILKSIMSIGLTNEQLSQLLMPEKASYNILSLGALDGGIKRRIWVCQLLLEAGLDVGLMSQLIIMRHGPDNFLIDMIRSEALLKIPCILNMLFDAQISALQLHNVLSCKFDYHLKKGHVLLINQYLLLEIFFLDTYKAVCAYLNAGGVTQKELETALNKYAESVCGEDQRQIIQQSVDFEVIKLQMLVELFYTLEKPALPAVLLAHIAFFTVDANRVDGKTTKKAIYKHWEKLERESTVILPTLGNSQVTMFGHSVSNPSSPEASPTELSLTNS